MKNVVSSDTAAPGVKSTLKRYAPVLLATAAVLAVPALAAASSAGAGLPWESPLQTLQKSITGPVAMVISILAFVVAGVGLVFGGEMNEFVRKAIMAIMAVAFIVGAVSILSTLFGTGALIVAASGLAALA